MRNNHLNALLAEILIAVLFFALSATVILEAFSAAQEQSLLAGGAQEALAEAQSLADRLSLSADMSGTLEAQGFARTGEEWTLERGDYALEVSLGSEKTQAGRLATAQVRAVLRGETLFELPCARYEPEEVPE